MTTSYPQSTDPAGAETGDQSIGTLIGEVAGDVSKLFRQEVALAKAELKEQATKTGKAGGLLAGAGFAAYLVAVLLSLAAVFGLGEIMPLGWAAVVVAVGWAIVGAVLYVTGRNRLRDVDPVPRQTVETLREDAQWVRDRTR